MCVFTWRYIFFAPNFSQYEFHNLHSQLIQAGDLGCSIVFFWRQNSIPIVVTNYSIVVRFVLRETRWIELFDKNCRVDKNCKNCKNSVYICDVNLWNAEAKFPGNSKKWVYASIILAMYSFSLAIIQASRPSIQPPIQQSVRLSINPSFYAPVQPPIHSFLYSYVVILPV